MTPYLRPRRSMLYVPGCAPRYLHKARTLKVDSLIFDLGDSVLVENKESLSIQMILKRQSPKKSKLDTLYYI